jgi:nucleoside phosphorylase
LADGTTQAGIAEHYRKLLGNEMEAYSIYLVASEAPVPRPAAFAIKSVVDFADPQKADASQAYAAYASCEVLKHLVQELLFT